jgi:tetratricopeptide (TPR) repeat protein
MAGLRHAQADGDRYYPATYMFARSRPPRRSSRLAHPLLGGALAAACLVLPTRPATAQAAAGRPPESPAQVRRELDQWLAQRAADSSRVSPAIDRSLADTWRRYAEALELALQDDSAIAAWRAALTVAQRVADSATLSNAHHSLGLLFWSGSVYDSALFHFREARALRTALGERARLGRTLNSIGATYYQLGLYEPALEAFVQAREIWRLERDELGSVRVLVNIGKTYHDWRQYERALPVLQEAVTRARALRDSATLGYALNTLAELQLDLGALDDAHQSVRGSRAAYSSSTVTTADSLSGWSLNATTLGKLRLREGAANEARELFSEARRIATLRGSVRGEARALLHLGDTELARGDRAAARRMLTQSLALSRNVEQRALALDAIERLATLEEADGASARALQYWRASRALRDTIFNQASAQRVASLEARVATEREQQENARLREEQRVQAVVIARQRQVNVLGSVILTLAAVLVGALVHYNQRGRQRELALAQANTDLADANASLRTALAEVRTLKGLIPICSSCKQVRDDDGYWQTVEAYLASRSDATFSHGICQSCGPKLYGEHWHAAVADANDGGTGTS